MLHESSQDFKNSQGGIFRDGKTADVCLPQLRSQARVSQRLVAEGKTFLA